MKLSTKLLLSFSLLFSLTSKAALIQNGSFEINSDSSGYSALAGGDTSITGWTTIHSGVELFKPSIYGGYASEGNYVVDINNYIYSNGGIEQSFATVIGESYTFSFDVATTNTYGRLGVSIFDVSIGSDIHSYNITNKSSVYNWETYTFEYTATELTTTLAFSANTDSYKYFTFIDNVNGAVTAVPEPSIVALMGLGIFGLGLTRRKMKKIN